MSQKKHSVADGEMVETHFVSVTNWLAFLLEQVPCLLAGGKDPLQDQLETFWSMYKYHHGGHAIFSEDPSRLCCTIPIVLFGDEGKGPKRGNYMVMTAESPLGLEEMPSNFTCSCASDVAKLPPEHVPDCYGPPAVSAAEEAAQKQTTNYKGHSYLTRHVLFGLPDWVYKHHPEVFEDMMSVIAKDLDRLFRVGLRSGQRTYYAALIGVKGDFKQVAEKVAHLTRSYAHLGRVNHLGICSLCMAGTSAQIVWDQVSHDPAWASTMYQERPWNDTPAFCRIPYDSDMPEDVFKLDPFHLYKVGLGRDLAGGLVLLARLGYYDLDGESKMLKHRIKRAFRHFRLWCISSHKQAALRYFSLPFFNVKRLSAFAWSNSKGSDTVLLLEYLAFFSRSILNRPGVPNDHVRLLKLLCKTIEHGTRAFSILYTHPLWLHRTCAQNAYCSFMSLLFGFQALAAKSLAMGLTFFGLKPKFHAIHHIAYQLKQALCGPGPRVLNPLVWGCEMNEDHIYRKADNLGAESGCTNDQPKGS